MHNRRVARQHTFCKGTGLGGVYAAKNSSMQVGARYQSMRIVAAYDTAQLASS